jgi:hypothetical protein
MYQVVEIDYDGNIIAYLETFAWPADAEEAMLTLMVEHQDDPVDFMIIIVGN